MFTRLLLVTVIFTIFATITIYLRPKLYKTKLFKPMIKNIKLSLLPLLVLIITAFLSLILMYISSSLKINTWYILAIIVASLGLIIWLLFLPNSGYLITELNLTHREEDKVNVPIWYDIISVLSLALSGVYTLILNVAIVQLIYLIIVDPPVTTSQNQLVMNIMCISLFIISSFGIYLGRYIRFNSWDVLHPLAFLKKLINHFKQKGAITNCLLFIIFHSLFFYFIYLSFDIWSIF